MVSSKNPLIAFSKNEKFLLSGGDDMQVQMWNLLTSSAPEPLAVRHFSNIFRVNSEKFQIFYFSVKGSKIIIRVNSVISRMSDLAQGIRRDLFDIRT